MQAVRGDIRAQKVETRLVAPGWLSLLAAAIVLLTVIRMGDRGYVEQSLDIPGLATSLTSAVLELVATLAGAVTLGALGYVAFVGPRPGRSRFAVRSRELSLARTASLAWLLSVLLLIPVDAADASGVSLGMLLRPGALGYLIQAAYLPQAWIVVAIVVAVIALGTNWRSGTLVERHWPSVAGLFALAVCAVLPPVLVTQVLVGPNHDQGSDAAALGTPAAALAVGLALVTLNRLRAGRTVTRADRDRLLRWLTWCLGITLGADLVVAWFETWPFPPASTATAWLFLGRFLVVGTALVLVVRARRRLAGDGDADPDGARGQAAPRWRVLNAVAVLLAVDLGLFVAMSRIPPPQYFVPTSIRENFLGYQIDLAPTALRLLLNWRLNLLFLVLAVTLSALYLLGVRRLHRRDDRWPVGRTLAWLTGWVLIVATTSTGLGRYSNALLSMHMLLHMSLNMFGPLMLCLAAPVTLALRTTTPRHRGQPPGPHEWVSSLMESKFARFMLHPGHALFAFTASYYLLYFTPLFDNAMRFHWAHQLMNLEFVFIGYLFYSVIIGADRAPRELPHIARLGLLFAAMPFHAFFGVIVMTTNSVIAEQYYSYLQVPWHPSLTADQYLAGEIAWATGEVPLAIVVIALLVQWSRADARQSTRTDRHIDLGLDDSFDAYNAMLARLNGAPAAASQGGTAAAPATVATPPVAPATNEGGMT